MVKIESSLVLRIIRIFPRRFERLNMREYTQLSEDERYTIYGEKHKGKTNVEIAKILNRHPATIGRELKRNKGLMG